MSTVYTVNNKVLKNAANDKWLTKKETPPVPQDEVTIGTQTWKNVNLAVDDGGTGITHRDNVTANGINFGTVYYYTWDAANRIANSISGWHLPSMEEFQTLVNYVGTNSGLKLSSTFGWDDGNNGTNDYGFNLLPLNSYDGSNPAGNRGMLLASNKDGNNISRLRRLASSNNAEVQGYYNDSMYPVRLIKDT